MKLELTDKELGHLMYVLTWLYYEGIESFFEKPASLNLEDHSALRDRIGHIITARHVLATENG